MNLPPISGIGVCMNDRLHILMADYVPIANKGEEAIVRGVEDMLSDGRPVALGLFDNVPQVTQRENITLFPRDWLFRFEGNSALSGRGRILMQARIALELRLGIQGPLRNLTLGRDGTGGFLRPRAVRARGTRRRLLRGIVRHHSPGQEARQAGRDSRRQHRDRERPAVQGLAVPPDDGQESDFCFFRERHSCENMKQVCRDPGKLRVGPDPAFAMRPAPPEAAREVLESCGPCRKARESGRPVIAATVLEKGRVYAGFRPDLQGQAKQQAHAKYLAAILDDLISKYGAFVLFLPHSVETDASDIVAAQHVIEQMKATAADYAVLEQDCGPRLLKSIIGQCDFLVGERTHSLIGSVSVGTPFAALTNRQDTRTHGIIGEMCRCEDQIIDMDVVSEERASRKVQELFESRDAIRTSLGRIREELCRQIEETVRTIKGL